MPEPRELVVAGVPVYRSGHAVELLHVLRASAMAAARAVMRCSRIVPFRGRNRSYDVMPPCIQTSPKHADSPTISKRDPTTAAQAACAKLV